MRTLVIRELKTASVPMRVIPISVSWITKYFVLPKLRHALIKCWNLWIGPFHCLEHIDSKTKGIIHDLMFQTVNGFPSVIKYPLNVVGPPSSWRPPFGRFVRKQLQPIKAAKRSSCLTPSISWLPWYPTLGDDQIFLTW